ncbi:MAG: type II toxin-antitoxin system HicB family antitoxin [Oligoflexia bacterium]|nr:type II toxin-antitoxin system HicB family antitoxin [Oligoflexia bacterium]
MIIEGKIWKNKKAWLIEIPILDLMTQGKSRANALEMIKDAVELLIDEKNFSVKITDQNKERFTISSSDTNVLMALILRRQREKNQLSLKDITNKMHYKSRNSYARYELGRTEISITKFDKLFFAITNRNILIKVA